MGSRGYEKVKLRRLLGDKRAVETIPFKLLIVCLILVITIPTVWAGFESYSGIQVENDLRADINRIITTAKQAYSGGNGTSFKMNIDFRESFLNKIDYIKIGDRLGGDNECIIWYKFSGGNEEPIVVTNPNIPLTNITNQPLILGPGRHTLLLEHWAVGTKSFVVVKLEGEELQTRYFDLDFGWDQPDLAVENEDIQLLRTNVDENGPDTIEITVTIRNVGVKDAGSFDVLLEDKYNGDVVKTETQRIYYLKAESETTITVTWQLDFGHTVYVYVDSGNEISERTADNNEAHTLPYNKDSPGVYVQGPTGGGGTRGDIIAENYPDVEVAHYVENATKYHACSGGYYLTDNIDIATDVILVGGPLANSYTEDLNRMTTTLIDTTTKRTGAWGYDYVLRHVALSGSFNDWYLDLDAGIIGALNISKDGTIKSRGVKDHWDNHWKDDGENKQYANHYLKNSKDFYLGKKFILIWGNGVEGTIVAAKEFNESLENDINPISDPAGIFVEIYHDSALGRWFKLDGMKNIRTEKNNFLTAIRYALQTSFCYLSEEEDLLLSILLKELAKVHEEGSVYQRGKDLTSLLLFISEIVDFDSSVSLERACFLDSATKSDFDTFEEYLQDLEQFTRSATHLSSEMRKIFSKTLKYISVISNNLAVDFLKNKAAGYLTEGSESLITIALLTPLFDIPTVRLEVSSLIDESLSSYEKYQKFNSRIELVETGASLVQLTLMIFDAFAMIDKLKFEVGPDREFIDKYEIAKITFDLGLKSVAIASKVAELILRVINMITHTVQKAFIEMLAKIAAAISIVANVFNLVFDFLAGKLELFTAISSILSIISSILIFMGSTGWGAAVGLVALAVAAVALVIKYGEMKSKVEAVMGNILTRLFMIRDSILQYDKNSFVNGESKSLTMKRYFDSLVSAPKTTKISKATLEKYKNDFSSLYQTYSWLSQNYDNVVNSINDAISIILYHPHPGAWVNEDLKAQAIGIKSTALSIFDYTINEFYYHNATIRYGSEASPSYSVRILDVDENGWRWGIGGFPEQNVGEWRRMMPTQHRWSNAWSNDRDFEVTYCPYCTLDSGTHVDFDDILGFLESGHPEYDEQELDIYETLSTPNITNSYRIASTSETNNELYIFYQYKWYHYTSPASLTKRAEEWSSKIESNLNSATNYMQSFFEKIENKIEIEKRIFGFADSKLVIDSNLPKSAYAGSTITIPIEIQNDGYKNMNDLWVTADIVKDFTIFETSKRNGYGGIEFNKQSFSLTDGESISIMASYSLTKGSISNLDYSPGLYYIIIKLWRYGPPEQEGSVEVSRLIKYFAIL